ncbi:ABC transporter ATP-binding protein [Nordella sp. HKS 07]|uniref:ABC transporter ATP-binding protein n=1 Tax=Nordella sp. HKS 07 TaxID=2712222 RepID=UPI0013E1BB49|nr:ABC transporter ATP-binding protein [Nordella sp. HKS 07]QIG47730.1 ABC transporter ATP-binding protein [Nordella sp. HKS 07]
MTDAYLDIRDLSVALHYGGGRLLRRVSLAVKPGEVHALVGESGAGKSMIARAVFGILPKAVAILEGDVTLEGADLNAMPETARRLFIGRRAAFIPQDPLTALNPSKRIAEQISDRLIHILGLPKAKAHERAAALLDEVKIAEPERVMRLYPHELSGGMRQRVLIAAAFAGEPRLIVADEPTTALDVTVQKQILGLIAALQARHGTALLFITHNLGVVAKLCQTASVLYAGKVVEQAAVRELFANPRHAYTRALMAATPRYDRPEESLKPASPELLAELAREVAETDAAWARERADG